MNLKDASWTCVSLRWLFVHVTSQNQRLYIFILLPLRVLQIVMHPFATYVLQSYYKVAGWNEDNLYANLIRASHGRSTSQNLVPAAR